MLAFNQAHSSWRRLIIILATATAMAVMAVSSASSAPKFVAPEPIVSGPHSKTAVCFFTINQILADTMGDYRPGNQCNWRQSIESKRAMTISAFCAPS